MFDISFFEYYFWGRFLIIVTSRVSAGMSFENDNKGSKFVHNLRRDLVVRTKYNVKGPRFTSRQKKWRAQQSIADTIEGPLPSIDGHVGISVTMRVAPAKRNGRGPLWILVDSGAVMSVCPK